MPLLRSAHFFIRLVNGFQPVARVAADRLYDEEEDEDAAACAYVIYSLHTLSAMIMHYLFSVVGHRKETISQSETSMRISLLVSHANAKGR